MAKDYDIGEAFRIIEDDLLSSLMRNMERHKKWEEDEGFNWPMWQAEMLRSVDAYAKKVGPKLDRKYRTINNKLRMAIKQAYETEQTLEEARILEAIKAGANIVAPQPGMSAVFFEVNQRALDALLNAVDNDMRQAEYAILSKHRTEARAAIFNAQVYYQTTGDYYKAVDLACRSYIDRGIDCVKYRDGKEVGISTYAQMVLRTSTKRAALMGASAKRREWGVHTVITNKRSDNPCPKCVPFVGKVMIDDVYSGGTYQESMELGIPLLSDAIAEGFLHPNCKDGYNTYYPGISTPPEGYTKAEAKEIIEDYEDKSRTAQARRLADKYQRRADNYLDETDKRRAQAKADEWKEDKANDNS